LINPHGYAGDPILDRFLLFFRTKWTMIEKDFVSLHLL